MLQFIKLSSNPNAAILDFLGDRKNKYGILMDTAWDQMTGLWPEFEVNALPSIAFLEALLCWTGWGPDMGKGG